jgi:hypothetical protein
MPKKRSDRSPLRRCLGWLARARRGGTSLVTEAGCWSGDGGVDAGASRHYTLLMPSAPAVHVAVGHAVNCAAGCRLYTNKRPARRQRNPFEDPSSRNHTFKFSSYLSQNTAINRMSLLIETRCGLER